MGMEILVSGFWVYFTSTFKIMQPGYRFINFTRMNHHQIVRLNRNQGAFPQYEIRNARNTL